MSRPEIWIRKPPILGSILIYMELLNFLTIIGVDANYKKALQGIIIIVAVALTLTRDRKTIAK